MIDKTENLTDEWMPAFDIQTGTDLRDDTHCPVCGSSSIEGGDIDFFNGYVYQQCTCNECGSKLSSQYDFAGFYVNSDGRYKEVE